MHPRPSQPRIAPTTEAERTVQQRELLDTLGGNGALNIFATLAHHVRLFRRWLPFGGVLLQGGTLPERDRELVILRVAFRCGARYEWGQHVGIARAAGVTDDEIRRVATGPDVPGWSEGDAMVLRAVDELHDDFCITDDTWAALASHYSTEQLIELPMLAGHYALLAGALNSFGVQPEGALPELGQA